jgi:hypothetical protein
VPHLRPELKCLYMIYTMDYLMKDGVGLGLGALSISEMASNGLLNAI